MPLLPPPAPARFFIPPGAGRIVPFRRRPPNPPPPQFPGVPNFFPPLQSPRDFWQLPPPHNPLDTPKNPLDPLPPSGSFFAPSRPPSESPITVFFDPPNPSKFPIGPLEIVIGRVSKGFDANGNQEQTFFSPEFRTGIPVISPFEIVIVDIGDVKTLQNRYGQSTIGQFPTARGFGFRTNTIPNPPLNDQGQPAPTTPQGFGAPPAPPPTRTPDTAPPPLPDPIPDGKPRITPFPNRRGNPDRKSVV